MATLDFEKPILELEHKINDLRQMGSKRVTLEPEIKRLESKLEKLKNDIYNNMTPWQRVQIARHPKRPYTLDYIRMMTDEFLELHGDRLFADDKAMIGGFAKIDGQKVMIIGHQKGRDVKENVLRNFGCAHPEGYRKAMRLMRLAAKFHVPVICLIDTPGRLSGHRGRRARAGPGHCRKFARYGGHQDAYRGGDHRRGRQRRGLRDRGGGPCFYFAACVLFRHLS